MIGPGAGVAPWARRMASGVLDWQRVGGRRAPAACLCVSCTITMLIKCRTFEERARRFPNRTAGQPPTEHQPTPRGPASAVFCCWPPEPTRVKVPVPQFLRAQAVVGAGAVPKTGPRPEIDDGPACSCSRSSRQAISTNPWRRTSSGVWPKRSAAINRRACSSSLKSSFKQWRRSGSSMGPNVRGQSKDGTNRPRHVRFHFTLCGGPPAQCTLLLGR